jgi:hypothetical protein
VAVAALAVVVISSCRWRRSVLPWWCDSTTVTSGNPAADLRPRQRVSRHRGTSVHVARSSYLFGRVYFRIPPVAGSRLKQPRNRPSLLASEGDLVARQPRHSRRSPPRRPAPNPERNLSISPGRRGLGVPFRS